MELPLIISVLTLVSAVRVPNAWPQQSNQTPNNVNRDNQQMRQDGILAQRGPTYNNINPFINNVRNIPAAGLIAPGNIFSNLPVDYNNWFSGGVSNNGYVLGVPNTNQRNLANNNINQLVAPNHHHHHQILNSPPAPQINYNVNPEISRSSPYREVENQVPYRSYTTPRTAGQSADFNTPPQTYNQRQRVNANQAIPTTVPITELDFSPLDPFPHRQQDFQASTQITNHNNMFDTDQLLNGYDPFSQNPQPNRYKHPQRNGQTAINKPLFQVADNRESKYNTAKTAKRLEFDPFKKVYRDHRTHELTEYDADLDKGAVPVPKRLETERAPIVKNHEYPAEVPTRPFYPGEAKWSKPGVKYRPFNSKQQYKNLEESNEQPDGYDTFEEAQKLFEKQQQQFGLRSKQLSKENNSPSEEASTNGSEEGETFVPTKLYAQVRHSEDEKHLPPESDGNGRLKELVKDHKIQTIYSEEGYEDSAYDHAGHEKKAENTEGFESDEKNKEANAKKKIPVKKFDRQSASYAIGDLDISEEDIEKLKKDLNPENDSEESNNDSEPAGTHYEEETYLNKRKPKIKPVENNIIKSKDIKIVTAKDKGGGKIEMEISSEVKAVRQPNNSTKIHKYVKIYPKMNKYVKPTDNITENEIPTTNEKKEGKVEADKRSLTLNKHEIFIEEIIDQTSTSSEEEYVSTTVTPSEYSEIVTMEIPATTQPTTSIPKLEVKDGESSETVDSSELYFKPKTRRKRFSDRIPEIEIDTDFIDNINHDLGKPTEKSKKPVENKYPYYNSYKQKGLHQDSPLRYAEDLKNVPKKTPGKLAFYELADRKMACSDVNPEVDPVPDRIKNADEDVEDEEEDEEGNDPATKEPRLGQLGDKIDCFKIKYFGDNPLDNPIFQEELVGPVEPIFSEIETISKKKMKPAPDKNTNGNEPLNTAASSYGANNEIEDGKEHKYGLKSWFPGKSFGMGENTERDAKFVNHFVERNPNLKVNVDLLSQQSKAGNNDGNDIKIPKQPSKGLQTPPTLITTPKYSLNLKPKHIYDQIQLLDYLPEDEFDEIKKAIEANLPKANKTEVTTSLPNMNKTETVLRAPVPKKKNRNAKTNGERRVKMLTNNEERMKTETSDERKPESLSEIDALQFVRKRPRKPLYEIFDVNKFIPNVPKIPPVAKNSNPAYLSPIVSVRNPTYQIFDINKYLPTTPFPVFKNFITQSTVLPKYKVFSEVFYKEDIKPNEQLNVFTDVLKHINSFPKLKDSFSESSEPISVKLSTKKLKENFPENAFEQAQADNKNFFSSTIMTTFDTKMYASNHRYPQTEDPLIAERHIENLLNTYRSTNKPKRRRRIKTTTQETPVVIEESTSTLQYMGEPTEVMGMMPPIIQGYKTIYHPKRDNSQHISSPTIVIEEKKINKYYVQGMRPPPKQKVFLYSDFLTDNHIIQRISKTKRSKLRRRSKRDAQRPAYAEVSRNRGKTEMESETKKEGEDDYVPHRPKNYHYDEKTGKIVYDKKPQEETAEEEEVEYIEVVEEVPKTTEKPKQSPIFATATPPPDGQSYTDFVKLLKSASNYHEIPDPTTTEKGAEKLTEKAVSSTLQPMSTNPPEFLSILAKVRNDTAYKLIKDEKKTTSKPPQEKEEIVEEEEESQVANVKNSPGGYDGSKPGKNLYDGLEAGANLEIFDIADFLPNIKSYLPKTAVDTSKYKTIERPQVRHRLSSRYNSDDDKELKNINTNKQPLLDNKEAVRQRVQVTTPLPEIGTQKQIRLQRRRTTTAKSVEDNVTIAPQPTAANEELASAENNSTITRRRRRKKRVRGTPGLEQGTDAEPETTNKALHRRSERESHLYADGNEKYERFVDSDGTMPEISIPTEDYVDYEEVTDTDNSTASDKPDISVIAKKLLDVFKNYDKAQRHGGNYRKEDEVNKTVTVAAPEIKDKTNEPIDIFKAYDKEKKHGGNYKKEDEENTTTTLVPPESKDKTKKAVNVFKSYDKLKKHGGNYKAEKENVVKAKEQTKSINPEGELNNATNAEAFNKFDESKKHGGNYRPENEEMSVSEQDESGLEKTASIQISNVNVFQDYDETKKHGGNYKSENNDSEKPKVNIELEEPKALEVIEDVDGRNYTPENEVVVEEHQVEGSQLRSSQIKQNAVNDDSGKKVEVFKDYNKSKKHGGNYKIEESQLGLPHVKQSIHDNSGKKESVEVFEQYDQTIKHGGNYKPKKDLTVEESQFWQPQNAVNDNSAKKGLVEVFKNNDKTKEHGGDAKPEKYITVEEPQTQESQLGLPQVNALVDSGKKVPVEVFKDYDKTIKHGGNYKSETDGIVEEGQLRSPQNVVINNPGKKELTEVFIDYDKTKEHGGNYKPEQYILVEEQQTQESQLGSPHVKHNVLNDDSRKKGLVEVFKEYDQTKKHGGNYMRQNDTLQNVKVSEKQEIEKVKDVETFMKYNEEQKTGGNYKREDELIEPKAEETHISNTKVPQNKRFMESRNDVQRLADVVLKPEAFYTDLKLPLDINALKIVTDLPAEELEEIVKSEEDDKSKEEVLRRNDEADDVVIIGNQIKVPPVVEQPTTTTMRPLFIRDPSKRLYFYAPIR